MLVLGIESSCDETAAAVIKDGILLANVVNSQIDIHERYGGVVPEIASRQHLKDIYPVVAGALAEASVELSDIDCLAVTQGPGLIGSLLVGYCFTKALAMATKIPFVGVDHITGHLLSVFLSDKKPDFPYIAMVASGGHSSIFLVESPLKFTQLGRTRDDAAGEAFDKVAKLLELGYPGGPAISRLAEDGDKTAYKFPRAWLEKDSLDFSFSGLKTSVANTVNRARQKGEINKADICASFQEAVVEVLVTKTITAARNKNIKNIVLCGGVAANLRLRQYFSERAGQEDMGIFMPQLKFCTDNAAMIALAGSYKFNDKDPLNFASDVYSRSQF